MLAICRADVTDRRKAPRLVLAALAVAPLGPLLARVRLQVERPEFVHADHHRRVARSGLVKVASAIAGTTMPCADSSTICARRQSPPTCSCDAPCAAAAALRRY